MYIENASFSNITFYYVIFWTRFNNFTII